MSWAPSVTELSSVESVVPKRVPRSDFPDAGQRMEAPVSDRDRIASPSSVSSPAASRSVRGLPTSAASAKGNPAKFLLQLCLTLVLACQLLWSQRDEWRHEAWVSQSLQLMCDRLGCTVPAWSEPEALLIETSRFVYLSPAYRVEWTLRNQSVWPMRMPAMELTLTGVGDDVLVRKVFSPAEMRAPDRMAAGQSWDGELMVQLAQGLQPSGYRVRAFYP